MGSPRSSLSIDGVSVSVGSFVLTCDDLVLGEGITLLAGPNGAGKTTLLRAIAGSVRCRSGRISFNGSALDRRQVSMLPQRPTLPLDVTVLDVVSYALWLQGASHRKARCDAHEVLESFGLTDAEKKPVRALSGGMSRRLAIACAVVSAPDVLLLDEPTNDLDPVQKASVLVMIERLARGRIVIVSSHALHDLAERSERIVILNRGHLVASGSLDSLRQAYGDDGGSGPEGVYMKAVLSDDVDR